MALWVVWEVIDTIEGLDDTAQYVYKRYKTIKKYINKNDDIHITPDRD